MSGFTRDPPTAHASTDSHNMDSNCASYTHSKAGGQVRTKVENKRGRSNRRRRNKFPDYGRHRSPQQELIKAFGGDLDDSMDFDRVDGKEKGKAGDMAGDKNFKRNDKSYNIPVRSKPIGTNTLPQLRQRHDELAEYIKDTKKSIALGQEALMKEKARKAFQEMRKEQLEADVKKESEMDIDIDIS